MEEVGLLGAIGILSATGLLGIMDMLGIMGLVGFATALSAAIDPAVSLVEIARSSKFPGAIFVLLAIGPIVYGLVFLRYRNQNKRHFHELETAVKVDNLRTYDKYSRRITKHPENRVPLANEDRVEGSIVSGKGAGVVVDIFGKAEKLGGEKKLKRDN